MGAQAPTISWLEVEKNWLDEQPDGGLNLAYQCLERNLAAGRAHQPALIWRSSTNQRTVYTYAELSAEAQRFAAALKHRGIRLAERVCTIAPRRPELYIAALGTLHHGAVYAPLFSVYGPDPIRRRLEVGEARVVITTKQLYEQRIAPIRGALPSLEHIVLIDGEAPGAESWQQFCTAPAANTPNEGLVTAAEFPALLLFTSGTTGPPKGVLHVHRAAAALLTSGRLVLGLEPGTRYWCTADPGWVTGVAYGLLAPLLCGATLVVDEGKLEAARWYDILAEEAIQCWLTTPTALRLLRRSAVDTYHHELSNLERIFSTGEPLDPALTEWTQQHLNLPTRDAWWQSETGSIITAQYADDPLTPARMGRSAPGIEMIIAEIDHQQVKPITRPGQTGEILIKRGWPSMFRAYLGAPESYRQAFIDDWYRSGDLAQWDRNGELRFIGRADDVIKTAGHMVGPAEVEAVLNHHPEVVECGVSAVPDAVAGHLVAAWVVPRNPVQDAEKLRHDLIAYARQRLGTAVAPRELHFIDELPKTPSGKILRRELRKP
ncbi:acetyl-coenzyme A synthetase [Halorhodospira halochloris]|uniref:acetate--CoA ligase n=1 Tax=Halorhodospira halochloris TaxID=1052 RepID=A0A0X8XA05_HALHR|nr:AMP-binding protein [Halorhodospira halochloris]MBK1651946.1 AMP-dependent synthetase [Halorhodospira halochloris]BAU58237.1 acetyl-coenzyme A synthetase [Halorhodospira halochloris]